MMSNLHKDRHALEIDLPQIQAIALRDSKAVLVEHLLVRFKTGAMGAEFLDILRGNKAPSGDVAQILFAAGMSRFNLTYLCPGEHEVNQPGSGHPLICLNLGLTFAGLEMLIPHGRGYLRLLHQYAPAFSQGAAVRAAQKLGDVGQSAAQHWPKSFRATGKDGTHALITLQFRCANCPTDESKGNDCQHYEANQRRNLLVAAIRSLGQTLGVSIDEDASPPCGQKLLRANEPGEYVHFGYRDGITRVRVRGVDPEIEKEPSHEPGEFVLGYPNNANSNLWALAAAPEKVRTFFRNGTFGILRVMEQDEERFENAVTHWAMQLAETPEYKNKPVLLPPKYEDKLLPNDKNYEKYKIKQLAELSKYIKAKLCGRWPDGSLFEETVSGPPRDSNSTEPRHRGRYPSTVEPSSDDFNFTLDPKGIGCPFASHIRRMNPRGGISIHARERPLIRRGMPYGTPINTNNKHEKRGLLGLFFCASIERQFEHRLGQWADRMPLGTERGGNCKDPLIGSHDDPAADFRIPSADRKNGQVLSNFQPFVTTRGTLYAFYPSRLALERLIKQDLKQTDFYDDDPN